MTFVQQTSGNLEEACYGFAMSVHICIHNCHASLESAPICQGFQNMVCA